MRDADTVCVWGDKRPRREEIILFEFFLQALSSIGLK